MKNIQHADFIKMIDTDEALRSEITNLIGSYTAIDSMYSQDAEVVCKKIEQLDSLAGIYVRNLLVHRSATDYIGWTERKLIKTQAVRDELEYTNLILNKPIYESLGDNYSILLDSRQQRKEAKRRTEAKFDRTAPSMQLDMFSFSIYKNGLESGKPLTGADAQRHMRRLPTSHQATMEQRDLRNKYLKLIWDNSKNKTLSLVDNMAAYIDDTVGDDIDKPFVNYNPQRRRAKNVWADTVRFPYYTMTSYAHKHSVPTRIHSHGITESQIHDYVTGVPKKNPMTEADIIFAIDKLKILEHMQLQDTAGCPYFKMGQEQLISELQRDDNKELVTKMLKAHDVVLTQMAVNTDKIIQTIKAHHE